MYCTYCLHYFISFRKILTIHAPCPMRFAFTMTPETRHLKPTSLTSRLLFPTFQPSHPLTFCFSAFPTSHLLTFCFSAFRVPTSHFRIPPSVLIAQSFLSHFRIFSRGILSRRSSACWVVAESDLSSRSRRRSLKPNPDKPDWTATKARRH